MITQLRLRNYLSFHDVGVDLGRRNVLVGPNMSGKSNLIDSLKFLTAVAQVGLQKAFLDRNGFPEVIWKGSDDPRITLGLEMQVPGHETQPAKAYEYEITIVGGVTGLVAVESERLAVRTDKGASLLVDLRHGQGKLLHPDGSVAIATPVDPSRSALEFDVPGWEASIFRSIVSRWRFYRLVPTLMKQANAAMAQGFLTEYGDNFSSWLMTLQTGHPEEFRRIKQVATDVLPGLEEILTPPTQFATTYVATRETGLKRPVTVWRMSDGELVFLALLSLVFAPGTYGFPLYCVEEPENHLHPRLIDALVEVHNQRQMELGERAAQVIITTHSPLLVDRADLDEVLVLEKVDGATRCTKPGSKPHLRELLEREELGLGDLWYSGALGGR